MHAQTYSNFYAMCCATTVSCYNSSEQFIANYDELQHINFCINKINAANSCTVTNTFPVITFTFNTAKLAKQFVLCMYNYELLYYNYKQLRSTIASYLRSESKLQRKQFYNMYNIQNISKATYTMLCDMYYYFNATNAHAASEYTFTKIARNKYAVTLYYNN